MEYAFEGDGVLVRITGIAPDRRAIAYMSSWSPVGRASSLIGTWGDVVVYGGGSTARRGKDCGPLCPRPSQDSPGQASCSIQAASGVTLGRQEDGGVGAGGGCTTLTYGSRSYSSSEMEERRKGARPQVRDGITLTGQGCIVQLGGACREGGFHEALYVARAD